MHRGKFQLAVIVSLLQLSSFICAGHECGNNPLRQVLLVAKTTGKLVFMFPAIIIVSVEMWGYLRDM